MKFDNKIDWRRIEYDDLGHEKLGSPNQAVSHSERNKIWKARGVSELALWTECGGATGENLTGIRYEEARQK